jgi:hypothetical protein
MKTIKFLILLIILGLLGLLIYQNIAYFTTAGSLTLDLKFNQWQWASPALPNWAFWGICFGLGLLITGMKGLVTAYRLGREIKKKQGQIADLTARNKDLQARLDVFTHDPYIKKAFSDTESEEKPGSGSDEPGEKQQTAAAQDAEKPEKQMHETSASASGETEAPEKKETNAGSTNTSGADTSETDTPDTDTPENEKK